MNSAPRDKPDNRWQLRSDPGPPPETEIPTPTQSPPPDMRGQCLMFCPRCGVPATLAEEVCSWCGAKRCVGCGD